VRKRRRITKEESVKLFIFSSRILFFFFWSGVEWRTIVRGKNTAAKEKETEEMMKRRWRRLGGRRRRRRMGKVLKKETDEGVNAIG